MPSRNSILGGRASMTLYSTRLSCEPTVQTRASPKVSPVCDSRKLSSAFRRASFGRRSPLARSTSASSRTSRSSPRPASRPIHSTRGATDSGSRHGKSISGGAFNDWLRVRLPIFVEAWTISVLRWCRSVRRPRPRMLRSARCRRGSPLSKQRLPISRRRSRLQNRSLRPAL